MEDPNVLDMDMVHKIVTPPNEILFNCASSHANLASILKEQKRYGNSTQKKTKIPKNKPAEEIEPPVIETPLEFQNPGSPPELSQPVENEAKTELRKSTRMKNKIKEIEVNAVNCHQCKKIEITKNIITCSNESCRESYCFACIQKYCVFNKFLK